MADNKPTPTPANATPAVASQEQPKFEAPMDDTNIKARPADNGETVVVEFDEDSGTYAIMTNGLAAARYATEVEANSNLFRFKSPTRPTKR